MWRRLRPWVVILGVGMAAVLAIVALSRVTITVDTLSDTQIRVAYLALVALVILVAFIFIRRQIAPAIKRTRPAPPPPAPAHDRLAQLYAEHGLDTDKRSPPSAWRRRGSGPDAGGSQPMTILVAGFPNVGRKSLMKALMDALRGVEPLPQSSRSTPIATRLVAAPIIEIDTAVPSETLDDALHADLILFIVDQDLRGHDFDALAVFARAGRETWLVLNKADLYSEMDLAEIQGAIEGRLAPLSPPVPLLTVAADPLPALRAAVGAGGEALEEEVSRPPRIEPLVDQLTMFTEALGGRGARLAIVDDAS
jgi:hypothetical protein